MLKRRIINRRPQIARKPRMAQRNSQIKPLRVSNTGSVKKIREFKVKKPKIIEKKPQVTKDKRSPLRMGDSVFLESFSGKELGYSKKGKQIVRENPGLIRAVQEISRTQKPILEDPKGRFTIRREKPTAGWNTNVAYVLDLKGKKYFIKEQNDIDVNSRYKFDNKYKDGRDGVSEHIAIELLKKHKINVIPAHVSYVDPVSKKGFIVYEYTKLRTLEALHKSGDIKYGRYRNIKERLREIEKKINDNFTDYDLKKYCGMWDLATDNVFVSTSSNKFYVFDPVLMKK